MHLLKVKNYETGKFFLYFTGNPAIRQDKLQENPKMGGSFGPPIPDFYKILIRLLLTAIR
jgi:hypothetical protein